MAGSSNPSTGQEQSVSSQGLGSATWWNSVKPTLLVVGAVAIVLAFCYQRETALLQQHKMQLDNGLVELKRKMDNQLHKFRTKWSADLQDEKDAKLVVHDFFKGKLNSALHCYHMMRTFVHVLGRYTERQIKKAKNAGIMDKILGFLTTDQGADSPVLDGGSDPYNYVDCLDVMQGITNGLAEQGGRLDSKSLGLEGFEKYKKPEKRNVVSVDRTGANRLAYESMGEAEGDEENDEGEEGGGPSAGGRLNTMRRRLTTTRRRLTQRRSHRT